MKYDYKKLFESCLKKKASKVFLILLFFFFRIGNLEGSLKNDILCANILSTLNLICLHYKTINEKFKQHGYFKHICILLGENHYHIDNQKKIIAIKRLTFSRLKWKHSTVKAVNKINKYT